jgi:hypothetical protein
MASVSPYKGPPAEPRLQPNRIQFTDYRSQFPARPQGGASGSPEL